MNALNGPQSDIKSNRPQSKKITKADKFFAKERDFKDIKFIVKIRGIPKIEKKNSIGTSVFGYENKENIQFMYQKNVAKKNMLIYC